MGGVGRRVGVCGVGSGRGGCHESLSACMGRLEKMSSLHTLMMPCYLFVVGCCLCIRGLGGSVDRRT